MSPPSGVNIEAIPFILSRALSSACSSNTVDTPRAPDSRLLVKPDPKPVPTFSKNPGWSVDVVGARAVLDTNFKALSNLAAASMSPAAVAFCMPCWSCSGVYT